MHFSGQWLFKGVFKEMITGLESLHCLTKFSMKHDCTNGIIKALCRSSRWTLREIDIEQSKQVNDDCVPLILLCSTIIELNLFQTGLSDEAKGRLIANLPKLTHLPRGDYLCEALAWIEEKDVEPIYLIREFFPSQTYYFHEDWQMEMVAMSCPYISKMFYIFHEDYARDYLVLLPFCNLTHLELYGGDFHGDKIGELLLIRGQCLKALTLISVREIDYKALALLSLHCKKLENLTLNNCELVDYKPVGDVNSDAEYERREAYINMAKEAHEIVLEFSNLTAFTVSSTITSLYFVFVLKRAPHIKVINIGPKNEITDESMLKIFIQNPMTFLEEFHIEKSEGLSMMTVNMLVNNCDDLRAIGDLQKWSRIEAGQELCAFREMIRTENYDLDTSSNQRLRKYLDLRESEKKTYINLVAGPFLERLKLAEKKSHAL